MHYAEIQDLRQDVLWHGRIQNSGDGFSSLLEKIRKIEESNSSRVEAVFMNPTGSYHVPLKHFLEKNGLSVYMVDARRTVHMRQVMNLGTEKSDPEDAHVLAATPWLDQKYAERRGHDRSPLSEITRERELILKNATRITNRIHGDLAMAFPEFPGIIAVDSRTGMAVLEEYSVAGTIASVTPEDMLAFMRRSGRNHHTLDDAMKLVDAARHTIGIPDTDGVYAFRIRMNAGRLKEETSHLREVEREIEARSSGNKDIDHLAEMKGIGITGAATIVSEIGKIEQFDSALKLQSYGGKCPDMTGSGGKSHPRGITRVRNEHLSNASYESAVSLVTHRNGEFYNLFTRELEKRKSRTEAYVVVAKRLLFHVYSIMKNGKPYKERKPGKRGRDPLPVE